VNGADLQTEIHLALPEEQAYLDNAYRSLARMRDRAVYLKALGYLGGNVTEGGVDPHDIQEWERHKQERVDALSPRAGPLCFGRIDRGPLHRWYVGRRHVENEDGEPLVIDWRAPIAMPFYRATVTDTMGLSLRRRFLVEGRHIIDLFDEDLAHPSAVDAGAYVPDPLLADIGRTRTGEMRDIVATIQAEQDLIIRAPLESCIIVQGGPGTGKTAVGLHRAAFLLYQHRQALEREKLLIVGPNRIFLRYISQVLPSLGEVASVQLTIEGLAGIRFRVGLEDSPAVARLKGDPRMAEVIRRAAYSRVRLPTEDVKIPTSSGSVTLASADMAGIVEHALRRSRRVADGRHLVREQLVKLAWSTHAAKLTSDVTQQAQFEADVRASQAFKALVDKVWPTVTSPDAVRKLYGHAPTRQQATEGLLTPEEAASLGRPATRRASQQTWSRADLALLDEAEALISGLRQTYGHIVVDEAQDLSAMELRMIARRCRHGSLTILGDLAQATAPAAQTDWNHAFARLRPSHPTLTELTVGYRVPAPIMAFANRLLRDAAPGVQPPTSVRQVGQPPTIRRIPPAELGSAVAAEVLAVADRWPLTGVVVPQGRHAEITSALTQAGVAFLDGSTATALGEHVTVLPPVAAKGLEFDAVVVVEPDQLVEEAGGNLRLLYVALTRAVQHLSVLHVRPLPASLAAGGAGGSEPGDSPTA
jgi:DNA helicase IV